MTSKNHYSSNAMSAASSRTLVFLSSETEDVFLDRRKETLIRCLWRLNSTLLIISSIAWAVYAWKLDSPDQYFRHDDALKFRVHLYAVYSTGTFIVLVSWIATWRCSCSSTVTTRKLEVLALIELTVISVLIPLFDAYYAAEVQGININTFFRKRDGTLPYFSDARVVLGLTLLQAGSHLLLPIRWVVMIPFEVVGVVTYIACCPSSPEGTINALTNLGIYIGFIIVAVLGKRNGEYYERLAMLDVISEKTLRFQSDFKLQAINASPSTTDTRNNDRTSVHSSYISSDAPTSHYVFNIECEDEVDLHLRAIKEMGIKEHWLVKKEHLSFKHEDVLGQGAFGLVLLGEHFGAKVALKLPWEINVASLSALANEIRVLRMLKHPNIVGFHGVSVVPEHRLLILCEDYVSGQTLSRLLKSPPVDFTGKVRHSILLDICKALVYIHTLEPAVVHGDLKSSNVLIHEASYVAKLADFGLSRIQSGRAKPIGGSLRWMAPEILSASKGDAKPVLGGSIFAPSTDVFSFGRVAFHVITGQLPLATIDFDALALCQDVPDLLWPSQPVEWQAECVVFCKQCLCQIASERITSEQAFSLLRSWTHEHAADVNTDLLLEEFHHVSTFLVNGKAVNSLKISL